MNTKSQLLKAKSYKLKACARGQSLIEILVAVSVGTLMVFGAIAVISPALKVNTDTKKMQIGAALGKELLDNVRASTEGNWHVIADIATSSVNRYYLMTNISPFIAATGTETVMMATSTYQRYFYIDDVYRDAVGKVVVSGGFYDSSTKKATVTVVLPIGSSTIAFETYLTRSRDLLFHQTDWSGGGNYSGTFASASSTNRFATSSNANVSTTTGSIVIQGF